MHFIDLAVQQQRIRTRIEQNIAKVLDHGQYVMGPEIGELEKKLADFVGINYAIAVASGTDALVMPLMALGVKPGDAVFTTTFTFIATAEAVQLLGATPVLVDIDPQTFNIDPDKLAAAITRTRKHKKLTPRGIIPVDLFGQPADYDQINAIARANNLFVLEDAAQSFGASQRGTKAGALASLAATSFFPAKPLGCYGDGGMIFCSDGAIHEQLLSIRVHGQGEDKYTNVRLGLNGRMDTLQAAILLAKFELFDEEIRLRQQVAERYHQLLEDTVTIPRVRSGNVSAWAQYSVLHPRRDELIGRLKARSIPSAIYYPIPLHLQKVFSHLGHRSGDFPVAERIAGQIFSLPMHPYLNPGQQEAVCSAIKSG